MIYVKNGEASWHRLLTFTRTGAALTRCGRIIPGPEPRTSDVLPLEDRTCESCLRLAAHDGEPRDISNDQVTE